MKLQTINIKPENEKAIIESMQKDGWVLKTKNKSEIDDVYVAVFMQEDKRVPLNG